MITAILSMAVTWCLFYARIPLSVLITVCLGMGAALAYLGRHVHSGFLTIDVLAHESSLSELNPDLKLWTSLTLMLLCVAARSWAPGVFLSVVMPVLVICAGGLELHEYIHILTLPASFLMLGVLPLLFEASPFKIGVLGFPIFNIWLCVTETAQIRAVLVMARALGAVSCLYFLSLTTPMASIIGVMRRARCPDVIIELLYLTYRYIFILLSMYRTMKDAAKSRLGFANYSISLRTTGNIYAHLLSRCYRQANKNFDAMESRCYNTGIRFFEKKKKAAFVQIVFAAVLVAFTLGLLLLI